MANNSLTEENFNMSMGAIQTLFKNDNEITDRILGIKTSLNSRLSAYDQKIQRLQNVSYNPGESELHVKPSEIVFNDTNQMYEITINGVFPLFIRVNGTGVRLNGNNVRIVRKNNDVPEFVIKFSQVMIQTGYGIDQILNGVNVYGIDWSCIRQATIQDGNFNSFSSSNYTISGIPVFMQLEHRMNSAYSQNYTGVLYTFDDFDSVQMLDNGNCKIFPGQMNYPLKYHYSRVSGSNVSCSLNVAYVALSSDYEVFTGSFNRSSAHDSQVKTCNLSNGKLESPEMIDFTAVMQSLTGLVSAKIEQSSVPGLSDAMKSYQKYSKYAVVPNTMGTDSSIGSNTYVFPAYVKFNFDTLSSVFNQDSSLSASVSEFCSTHSGKLYGTQDVQNYGGNTYVNITDMINELAAQLSVILVKNSRQIDKVKLFLFKLLCEKADVISTRLPEKFALATKGDIEKRISQISAKQITKEATKQVTYDGQRLSLNGNEASVYYVKLDFGVSQNKKITINASNIDSWSSIKCYFYRTGRDTEFRDLSIEVQGNDELEWTISKDVHYFQLEIINFDGLYRGKLTQIK